MISWRQRTSVVVVVLVLVGGVVSSTATVSTAADPVAREGQRPVGGVTHSPQPAPNTESLSYWTTARMAAAEPRDLVVVDDGEAIGHAGAEGATLSTRVPRPYTNRPDRMVGRVFGRDSQGDFRCSGAVVAAQNRSTVWTAGHCVFNPSTDEFARQVIFVPAFSSARPNHRPYGTWRAFDLWAHNEWVEYGNYEVDVGAIVLRPLGGRRIQRRVGAHRIAFDEGAQGTFRPFGYPAVAPFNGWDQWQCRSAVTGRDVDDGFGPRTMRIDCDLGAGASGGPWLRRINAKGVATVGSVTSYRYLDDTELYGPYMGSFARLVYRVASTE